MKTKLDNVRLTRGAATKTTTRRIIEIAVSESEQSDAKLVSLCNDGTVWWRYLDPINSNTDFWERIPDIPQGENAPTA